MIKLFLVQYLHQCNHKPAILSKPQRNQRQCHLIQIQFPRLIFIPYPEQLPRKLHVLLFLQVLLLIYLVFTQPFLGVTHRNKDTWFHVHQTRDLIAGLSLLQEVRELLRQGEFIRLMVRTGEVGVRVRELLFVDHSLIELGVDTGELGRGTGEWVLGKNVRFLSSGRLEVVFYSEVLFYLFLFQLVSFLELVLSCCVPPCLLQIVVPISELSEYELFPPRLLIPSLFPLLLFLLSFSQFGFKSSLELSLIGSDSRLSLGFDSFYQRGVIDND